MSSRESKRKAPLPQKSKAKAGLQAAVAAAAAGAATKTTAARAGVAASRLPRGSDSAVAPNLAGFRNGMAAAFVGHGSNSPPTPNPSAVGSSHGRCGSISPSSPFGHQSSWDPAWDNSTHPPGGFMGLFNNQPHLSQNSHFVGAPSHYAPFKAPRPIDVGISFASMDAPQLNNHGSSSQGVEVLSDEEAIEVDSDIENVRTEKRIMWTPDEDEKLMSAWLKNSTDSSIGADRNNEHYWGDVVKSYNMTIPSQRKRNAKQAKDRWHNINRWTDLYECAKWKTYNEDLKNARKRKSYRIEVEEDENDDIEELLERPPGQKKAKRAKRDALAAKRKSQGSNLDDDGNSKESAIDVEKLDKFSKIQEDLNANRMKVLELQQKLSTEKLETTRLAHFTAQENKEAKRLEKESQMMQAYNSLISQDTSSMSDEEKVERVAAMKCLRKTLFPEMI